MSLNNPGEYLCTTHFSDGDNSIMGIIRTPDITLQANCLIRLTNYEVLDSEYFGRDAYLVIYDYEYVGINTEANDKPIDINRVKKWTLLCNLATSHPFESEAPCNSRQCLILMKLIL
jgi:hypothetical protein